MDKTMPWRIALILVIVLNYGNAGEISSSEIEEKILFDETANKAVSEVVSDDTTEKSSTSTDGNDSVSQTADRRMSLMDFFFNNKNNEKSNEIQSPAILPAQQQVQVHEQPNQLMLVREASFPNPNGGLLSRLILARRMARLQRLSNRLSILPSMFGLLQRQQQAPQQQVLNQRIGRPFQSEYNPADILLEGIGFKNASISPHRQFSRYNNQAFSDDLPFSQNKPYGKTAGANLFGSNEVVNQQYNQQDHSSFDEFAINNENFGLRQNIPSFEQQQPLREQQQSFNQQQQSLYNQPQQQSLYNQPQQQPLYNQQQQQPLYKQQQLRQQQSGYDQNSQLKSPQSVFEHHTQLNQQQLYDQEQQLKQQQQLYEQQEQLRQQQQQLYDQQQQQLRQQQLYDQQQQQQIKQQQNVFDKQQPERLPQLPGQQIPDQQEKQQSYDQQQLKLQEGLYEQQKQLKQLLLDQQERLKTQDERFQQIQQHLLQEQTQKEDQQKTNTQQSRESPFLPAGDRESGIIPNTGILDFGGGVNVRPGGFDVGVDIGADPFKSVIGEQNYNPGLQVNANIGLGQGAIDKTAVEPVKQVVYKPVPVVSAPIKVSPLSPLGLLPRPLLNLNGKVFFGAELGKSAGVTNGGGWK